VTGRKITPKNDLFLHCQRKTKQLLMKELSNVAPASAQDSMLPILELKRQFKFALI
jgi:hypothetical protein